MELFFKWIKQHLRIKAFYGTSLNAVKTQVWIAITIYVLISIAKKELALAASIYQILAKPQPTERSGECCPEPASDWHPGLPNARPTSPWAIR